LYQLKGDELVKSPI